MDVSLILTHRCNLSCGYCYAGDHYHRDIDDPVVAKAVDLLASDDADTVQLSFFGGEPLLAFDAMKRAVQLAEQRCRTQGRRLLLQCTTNGALLTDDRVEFLREHRVHVTVSIDGVKEAHDLNRPRAGGGSSFDQVRDGLRRLVDAGLQPDAMMVISPQTVAYTYRSVGFLWGEGVAKVRANMLLDAPWSHDDRGELREQLLAVAWELAARRGRGQSVAFAPFDRGRPATPRPAGLPSQTGTESARSRVVVGTTGHLYPCAPMVGADRDDGPEAALRIGHLDDGPARIARQVACEGTRCDRGGGCECAAYLETGSRHQGGPNGRWYGELCRELGAAVAAADVGHKAAPPVRRTARRPFLLGMAAAVGGLAVGVPALLRAGLGVGGAQQRTGPELSWPFSLVSEPSEPVVLGELELVPAPPPPDSQVEVQGGVGEPNSQLPGPRQEPEWEIDGDLAAPAPEPTVDSKGDLASPPAAELKTNGEVERPPR